MLRPKFYPSQKNYLSSAQHARTIFHVCPAPCRCNLTLISALQSDIRMVPAILKNAIRNSINQQLPPWQFIILTHFKNCCKKFCRLCPQKLDPPPCTFQWTMFNKGVTLNSCSDIFSQPVPRGYRLRQSFQYNTIQYNTIQYNTIQYNIIQYNTIKYNTIQYNTIQYNTLHYNTMQHNAIQYNTMQYNTIQYKTIQS